MSQMQKAPLISALIHCPHCREDFGMSCYIQEYEFVCSCSGCRQRSLVQVIVNEQPGLTSIRYEAQKINRVETTDKGKAEARKAYKQLKQIINQD